MNYLQLCQRLRQECGGSGQGPQTVANQVGENRLFVDWINQAWTEIQNVRDDWFFQWTMGQQDIAEGAYIVTLPNDLRRLETLLIEGQNVTMTDWPIFSRQYLHSVQAGRPIVAALAPNGQLYLNAVADKRYPLAFEYYTRPQILAENADIPTMPSEYHMLIVYKAMMYYGAYEAAGDVLAIGRMNYHNMLSDLEYYRLPECNVPGPLA